ncbi:MAG: arylsulfatase [Planctomycetes bacterium]|nr:arylsulfatase [Planctomycetota bacterium]
MRAFLLGLSFCCGCSSLNLGSDTRESRPPNVVIVFADDLGWGDVGVQGATGYATPNIDRLSREGVRLTDFYAAQPVCSASRAALLTGCYPNRIGIHGALGPGAKHGLGAQELTLAEMLRAKGYATACFGKWHLGHRAPFLPMQHGFDEYYGIPYSNDMWPFHPENPEAWGDLPTIEGAQVVGYNTDQTKFTGDFTHRAVDFIERNKDGPFFVYVAHPMPHVPLHAGKAYRGTTERGLFGDVISEIDGSVGAILEVLERTGNDRRTLFIFTSDNGPWLSYGDHAGSAGPLREGKGTTFEGGVRVPFVARYPEKIPANHVSSEPAMTIDILPTIAKLVGAELPEHPIDGLDIWPLLDGSPNAVSPHAALYFWYHHGDLEAMRSGPWKLHFPHGYRTMSGRQAGKGGIPGKYDYSAKTDVELYDLEQDIAEQVDVAQTHPQVVRKLSEMADRMRNRLGDRLQEVKGSQVRDAGLDAPTQSSQSGKH